MKRKISIFWVTVIFILSGVNYVYVDGACPNGIKDNGTQGIWIDINASPYTNMASVPRWGQYAYSPDGCAWFATSRVKELTGKNIATIYSGTSWYNTYYSSYGFSRGTTLSTTEKALACYNNHISVVEKVVGDTVYISEGGSTYYSNASYGYCRIGAVSKAYLMGASTNDGFLGFVYLGVRMTTDKTPPTISNVTVSNITNEGYTVTCTVSDNVGISKVLFPSWNSDIHRGEDAVWLPGTVSGNTASCRVSASSLKSGLIQGNYATHIYAYDAAGNFVSAGCNAYIDRTAPQISDVSIVSLDGKGYTIRCKATDNVKIDRVQFPSWSHKGDQDDLASNWSTNTEVKGSLHQDGYYYFHLYNYLHNNEFGKYATHIYAYDAAGNYTVYHDDNTNNINIPQYALEFYSGMFEAHSKDVNMIFARLMPPAEEIRFQNIKIVTTVEKDGEILSVERDYGENTYSPYLKGGGYYQVVDNKDLKGATKNFKTSIYLTDENGETIECWYQYDPAQYKDTYYLTVNIGSQTEVQYPADYTSNEYYEEACGDIITPLECSSGGYDRTFTANKAGRAYIVGKNLLTGETVIQVVDVIDPSDGSSYLKKDSSYQIKNGLLFGPSLKENTVQDVCSQFSQDNIICVDADGQALNSGDIVGTGIRIMNGEDILAECTVVIIGDIYGDGKIDSKDVSYLARYRLGKESLSDAQLAAADVYEDGKVDSKDVSKLARYRLGKDTIASQ